MFTAYAKISCCLFLYIILSSFVVLYIVLHSPVRSFIAFLVSLSFVVLHWNFVCLFGGVNILCDPLKWEIITKHHRGGDVQKIWQNWRCSKRKSFLPGSVIKGWFKRWYHKTIRIALLKGGLRKDLHPTWHCKTMNINRIWLYLGQMLSSNYVPFGGRRGIKRLYCIMGGVQKRIT